MPTPFSLSPKLLPAKESIVKALMWFVTGVVGGLALGHVMANDPRGRAILAELDNGAREFVDAVKAGYSERPNSSVK